MTILRTPPLQRPKEVTVGRPVRSSSESPSPGGAAQLDPDQNAMRRRIGEGLGVRPAASSPLPAVALAQMAGGGILPRFRRERRQLAAPPRPPAVKLGAHVANWRSTPGFPPTKVAGISPSAPFLTPPLQPCCLQPTAKERGSGGEVGLTRLNKSSILRSV
jgi:hypothetical protein